MFETIHIHARVEADGHLRVDVPLDLPAESEVDLTVSLRSTDPYDDEAVWQAHIDEVVGSFPDIERPPQPHLRSIDPL